MKKVFVTIIFISLVLAACQPAAPAVTAVTAAQNGPKVLAVQSYLADIAQNVAGDRITVESLIPDGVDPHAFEPTPKDLARISESQVLIVNGAGFEEWLDEVLKNAGGTRTLIVASEGLTIRQPAEGEHAEEHEGEHEHAEGDPHFWLDPTQVIQYVNNIRDGLSKADPQNKDVYAKNAAAYQTQLKDLDTWISTQVSTLPAEKRLLVTNHESFGYYADRYGFKITGTVIPSVSTGSSPSAQQMAALIEHIKAAKAPAIFLETGANPQLAQQIAKEAGVKVVTDLYTHSLTPKDGKAPNYIQMMKWNTQVILDALK